MFGGHNRLFEHFGKRDGLQDEYQSGLRHMSNRFSTGDGSDWDDISFGGRSSYVSRSSFEHDLSDSDYGTQSYSRARKQRGSGGFGGGSTRQRMGQEEDFYGFDAKFNDDLGNVYNSGMEDVIDDFQVRRGYRRDRYYRDRERGRDRGYRSRRGYDEDYMRERDYRSDRRRRRGRMTGDPFMLPHCASYFPLGPYGPRVQFCPYVPLMVC